MKQLFSRKVFTCIFITLSILLFIAFIYVNNVAIGTEPPIIPEGYKVISGNGWDFSCKISGDPDSTAIILLHGFPETSAMWTRMMGDLTKLGYYVIAPDQRGYSSGARPRDKEAYHISKLAEDVIGIADALALDKFHLVGHDWGSGVGWQVAAEHGNRLMSYTSLSVPHISAFGRAYKEDSEQYDASFYIRRFQMPVIPEFYLARNDYAMLKKSWSRHSEEELSHNLNVFSQKGAMSAAINWYRGNFGFFDQNDKVGQIDVPVLFIWGNKDIALKRSGVEWTKDYVTGYYRFLEMDAGHWLVQEKYEEVKAEIVSHIGSAPRL